MYIKMAVCDDEDEICSYIENILQKILTNKCIEYEIDVYNSGEKLCGRLEETRYDLLFLDIEFPNMNGIETGR